MFYSCFFFYLSFRCTACNLVCFLGRAFIRNEYASSSLVMLILTYAYSALATVSLIDVRHGGAELLGKSVRGEKTKKFQQHVKNKRKKL
jgi:hypothetical protein